MEKSFAMEMLQDLRKSNKRKDLIITLLILVILAITGMFVYYISNYTVVEDTETYTTDFDSNDGGIISIGGDVNNG